jgi:hypothetical protein
MTEHRHAAPSVGPHDYAPLARHDAHHPGGRCRHCYNPRDAHPVERWVRARPLQDTTGEDPYVTWLWRALFFIVLILVVSALLRLVAFIT